MWNIFSSGPKVEKTPEKPQIDKEEYDILLAENASLQQKINIKNAELSEGEMRLGNLRKKAKELESLVQIKAQLIQILGESKEGFVSSDLSAAEKLKKSLSSRVIELEVENSKLKENLKKSESEVRAKMSADIYSELSAKIKEQAILTSTIPNKTPILEIPKAEYKVPTQEQIRKLILEINNLPEVFKEAEQIPDRIEQYEKQKAGAVKEEEKNENNKKLAKSGWEPDEDIQ